MDDSARDPVDPATADGRFWDWWTRWEGPPPDLEGRDRDLFLFCGGAVATCEALLGPEAGRLVGESLTAGAILRREIERRAGNGGPVMGDGPDTPEGGPAR